MSAKEEHRHRRHSGFWESIRTIVYAILIALVIRTFAFEPFNIPSGSMIPNLLVGDYLFVSKYSYGYSRYSLPFGLPLIPGRILYSEPERGDVVVFKLPSDPGSDYIKRVVGLPGDEIQMREGRLYINGTKVERRRTDDYVFTDKNGNRVRLAQFIETLPNGEEHAIIEMTNGGPLDDTPVYRVPEGHFFMLGDNRDNSLDSRVGTGGVGFVPKVNLVGRAEVIFFSIGDGASWWQVWTWPTTIRWGRIFDGVS